MSGPELQNLSRQDLIDKVLTLDHELSWLRRQVFGTKSERFIPATQQLGLELGIPPLPPVIKTQPVSYQRTEVQKPDEGHGRTAMPTHLPIVEEIIEPADLPAGSVRIGEDISWKYEYKPGSLSVRVIIRPRYALPHHEGVVIAALPPAVIEKGNFAASFVASLAVNKYEHHIPLDRQRKMIHQQSGVMFAESSLCDCIRHSSFWLEPLHARLIEHILSCRYIQADETPIPVVYKDERGKTHRGFFWVYHDPVGKVIVFDYRKSHGREGPRDFLSRFAGILQIDGYEGYTDVVARPDIIRAACMAHVRRYFERALDNDKQPAEYALAAIKSWFAVEREAQELNLDATARLQRRQKLIAPSMKDFQQWLKQPALVMTPQSHLGKAVKYAVGQWKGFEPFLADGNVELSNNLIENGIRPVAIGRKNYMFIGSQEAAKRTAIHYSLLGTARLHGLNSFDYYTALLTRLPGATTRKIDSFLPWNWKTAQE